MSRTWSWRQKLAEPKAFTTRDYHVLLARKDIHAVLIASPDHWHTPMTIDAMAAGKDVYVEKPLTHKMREGARDYRGLGETPQDRPDRHPATLHAAHHPGQGAHQRRAASARFTKSP